ncbi:MAG TPA: flagellar motor protein MotB [Longimicrobiaceae bacterium]|nr:flagellar motor protein MotB [Longimicrobiaceae bacterium]
MAPDKKPIIIRKVVKKGHGGHHGGSWKVAYADFVTAMMAFFMVMWILGMDESTRKSIEAYFSANPVGITQGFAAGNNPLAVTNSPPSVKMIGRGQQVQDFRRVAQKILAGIQAADVLREIDAKIEIVVTEEGLRIELIEGASGESFFDFGSARLKEPARRALAIIAVELNTLSSPLILEGHTDAAQFGSPGYSNWELSADRANAARRSLERSGVPRGRILEIRGHADRYLRVPSDPLDPSNRRISILLPFTSVPGQGAPTTAGLPETVGAV